MTNRALSGKGQSASKRGKGRATSRGAGGVTVRWLGLVELANERSDAVHQRHYKLETLSRAIERLVATRDTLFAPALAALGFEGPIGTLSLRLVDETAADLRFLVTVATASHKRVSMILFAAKNSEERSAELRRRWRALTHANQRAPQLALRPLASGKVFLPDRHRRQDLGREIFCFVSATAESAYPLSLARGGRLCTFEPTPKLLSARDERAVRMLLVELACRMYDPKEQAGLLLSDLGRGQLMLRREPKRGFQLLVTSPDGLRTRLTVPRFVHELVTWEVKAAGLHLRVCPESLDDLLAAMESAVGRAVAYDWLGRYKKSVLQRKLATVAPATPAALSGVGIE